MIDVNDPRNQHLIAHPHFLKGIEHERERILKILDNIAENYLSHDGQDCNCKILGEEVERISAMFKPEETK